MNIYYEIWADGITFMRSTPSLRGIWRFYSMVIMTMSKWINLMVLQFALSDLGIVKGVYFLPVNIFQIDKLDGFLSAFIPYGLPFIVIDYFLFFHNNRYEKILPKYKYHNGNLCRGYVGGSILAFVGYMVIAILLS